MSTPRTHTSTVLAFTEADRIWAETAKADPHPQPLTAGQQAIIDAIPKLSDVNLLYPMRFITAPKETPRTNTSTLLADVRQWHPMTHREIVSFFDCVKSSIEANPNALSDKCLARLMVTLAHASEVVEQDMAEQAGQQAWNGINRRGV